MMKVNAIKLNTNYKQISFKGDETPTPISTPTQAPAAVDVLQFKSAVKPPETLGAKLAKAINRFIAKPVDADPNNWDMERLVESRLYV